MSALGHVEPKADRYRHVAPHPARDVADTLQLGLGALATVTLAAAFVGVLVLLGATWPLLLLALAGVGALTTELYRVEQRRVNVDIRPTDQGADQ